MNRRLVLGLLAGALLLAGQALAAALPPAAFIAVTSPNLTGAYTLQWKASPTRLVTYVLEEATLSDYSDAMVVSPTNYTSFAVSLKGRANGDYYYRVKAVLVPGVDESTWLNYPTPINVLLTALPPRGVGAASTSTTGNFRVVVTLPSYTAGATYVFEEDAGGGYVPLVGCAATSCDLTRGNGSYRYRAAAKTAVLAQSAWTYTPVPTVVNIPPPVVGSAACAVCHAATNTAWSAGRHANGNSAPGVITSTTCAGCHDPNKQGTTIGKMEIGCEGCHGTGDHPLTNLTAAVASCAKCHNSHVSVVNNIATKVGTSKHAITSTDHSGTCGRCHSLEGYLAFESGTENYGAVSAIAYNGVLNVSCAACHDSHGTGLRVPRDWNIGAAQYNLCTSCHNLTDATGTPIASGLPVGPTGAQITTVAKQQHSTDWYRNIASTHYDLPRTGYGLKLDDLVTSAPTTIEGYAVRKNKASACTDCHGHELYTNTGGVSGAVPTAGTIHTDWASSAHAGGLLNAKKALFATQAYNLTTTNAAAIMAVGVTRASGPAWEYYDWDAVGRQSCQRCHTSTGIMNFLTSPTTYNSKKNDFSHLVGWVPTLNASGEVTAATVSGQNELLYCWGCHSSVETGALRNPGAITENYAAVVNATTGTTGTVAQVIYPNVGPSNVCMGCHLGREVGQNITNITDANGVLGFVNSHYLTAGSTIFNQSGYEYLGQTYDSYGFHKNVGVNNTLGTDGKGPCVTCHMSEGNGHSWNFTADANAACGKCHSDMTDAKLITSEAAFAAALGELKTALDAKGIYFHEANPYFFTAPWIDYTPPAANPNVSYTNWNAVAEALGVGLSTDATGKGWKNVMGAAFNYNLLKHDPGAFAHNRAYALKLIADSIDFIQDGVIDGDSSAASTALSASITFGHTSTTVSTASPTLCSTCHAAAPHYGGTALVQAQYVVSSSVHTSACANCHTGGIVAPSTINAQFAQSAHGDVIGDAWKHYDWRSSERATCARCHNATAYVAKLGIETDVTNIFNAADVNLPNEVLRCNACHLDISTGSIQPVALTQYTETFSDGGTFVYPYVGKSNLCLRCHSGRESGGTIKAKPDAPSTLAFVNSHYLSAGGTLFTTTGYTYTGLSYANSPAYLHNKGGIADTVSPQPTDRGPCAECHMGSGTADHTWGVVAKDASGVITAVTSTGCSDCHSGVFAITPVWLNTAATQYKASLVAFDQALQLKGIYFYNASPYIFTAPYVVGGTNAPYTAWGTAYGDAGWKNTMGAAFNLNLLEHDPGAYAHNSRYTRRLIRDSIDWIDDGLLTNSVPATLTSLQSAGKLTAQQKADALAYLGATRP